eukprot:6349564-Pyramimonas_sp.AAC.1
MPTRSRRRAPRGHVSLGLHGEGMRLRPQENSSHPCKRNRDPGGSAGRAAARPDEDEWVAAATKRCSV